MKNIIKMIGLITLICFSFFYTDKVITVLNEQDPLMIQISEVKNKYSVKPIESIINNDTIIPGISGKEVDVEKSYNSMKQIGVFKEILLQYKTVLPKNRLENNKDKYIINGNDTKKEVALIFIINDKNTLDTVFNNINKTYVVNLFINYEILSNNFSLFKDTHFSLYSYGNNGKYNKDILVLENNLINKFNKPLYCISEKKDSKTLNTCMKMKMNTILPTYIYNENAYNLIKNNLKNGNIILLESNNKNIMEFNYLYRYIFSKGYKVVSLEELLNENRE